MNCSECSNFKPMEVKKKPTISELEEILKKPDGSYKVRLLPNGEITAEEVNPEKAGENPDGLDYLRKEMHKSGWMSKPQATAEECLECGIPREYYSLKHEPGISNPDYNMGACAEGHTWGKKFTPITTHLADEQTLEEMVSEELGWGVPTPRGAENIKNVIKIVRSHNSLPKDKILLDEFFLHSIRGYIMRSHHLDGCTWSDRGEIKNKVCSCSKVSLVNDINKALEGGV